MKKRLLVISAAFPPCGGSGVRRILKIVKFLPLYGWEPLVLTERNPACSVYDYSLLGEVGTHAGIYRCWNILTAALKIRNHRLSHPRMQIQKAAKDSGIVLLLRWIRQHFVLPDMHIFWLPLALVSGVRLLLLKRVSAIYATGDPFSNHVIGSILRRITGKPLVIEFRDAWVADPSLRRGRFRRSLEGLLEGFSVRTANSVISVTQGVTEDFRARYPNEKPGKFVTITNGFDSDDAVNWSQGRVVPFDRIDTRKLTIVHTGRLMGERTPKYFLLALREALDQGMSPDSIEVVFVGENVRFNDGASLDDYVRNYQLEHVVRSTGFLSRKRSLWYQFSADVLLLLIGIVDGDSISRYGLAGKVFDYMLAGKPILAIGDSGGAVEKLFKDTGIGRLINSRDIENMRKYLIDMVARHSSGRTMEVEPRCISRFDMKGLTGDISMILNHLVGAE